MAPCFEYELTPIPTSLFKESALHKACKGPVSKSSYSHVHDSQQISTAYVLDGGALIHRVKRAKKTTYKVVAKQYVTYVSTMYGKSCIVFYGCDQGSSIKDHEHQGRVGRTLT